MKKTVFTISLFAASLVFAAEASMKQMPTIQPKKTVTVQTKEQGEDLLDQRGFGEKESEVRMMNLMMVGGSGYEGMDMNEMAAKTVAASGHQHSMMVASNEQTQHAAPAATTPAPSSELKYEAKIVPPQAKVGSNVVTITVMDASGKPKAGLKPKAQVYMTSMDMGTEEPRVRETAPGQYQLKANFTMKGPWAVKLITTDEHVFDFNAGAGNK